MLARTREGVGRVASIVHTMRGLARTAPPVMESVSLQSLVAASLELVQGRMRRDGIEIHRIDPPEPLPPLSCVSTQISQVIINLLVNAVQAIEEANQPADRSITVAIRRSDGYQILEITDTGAGIPPEVLPRLFDPFYTTKVVGEGTGLGLSISHGIITGHGGKIEVDGRPGDGACFRVMLPERAAR
jgi:signal transduction histidine kinase